MTRALHPGGTITAAPSGLGWQEQAACLGLWDLFFTRDPGPDDDLRVFARAEMTRAEDAKRICRTCPVTAECETFAVETGQRYGIWSGEDREHGLSLALDDPPGLCSKSLHLMTEDNTKPIKGTTRVRCRACLRDSDRRTRSARHARMRQVRREEQKELRKAS